MGFWGTFSLIFNREKTEILKVGKHQGAQIADDVRLVDNITILGTQVGYNSSDSQEQNMRDMLLSLRRELHVWKQRNLTLFDKIQIIKSFGVSTFIYLFSSVSIPSWVVKEIDTIFYEFLWKGKDRIRRNVLIQQIEKGGPKMVDIKSVISAQQLTWVLRMQKESSQAWYNVFNYYTRKYGGIFLFICNFDADRLSSQIPPFYASIF